MDFSLHPSTLQACTEKEMRENRIDELPDDILIHILSFVTMKEAGRTSLLSKRWRYVWAYIGNLNFDGREGLDEEFLDEELLEVVEPRYSSWVDQVVSSHKASTIDEFIVQHNLGADRMDNIDNWLRFAVEKRVKRLDLDVATFWGIGDTILYTFPSLPFRNSLTSLRLAHVEVSGEVLEQLLSDCQNLELLSVTDSDSLVDLKVAGPSLNLKIYCCFEIQNLEISAPKLEFFHYGGPKISSPFKSIPKLAELNVGGMYANHLLSDFLDISGLISHIEVLTLLSISQIKCLAEVFPVCTGVKTLDITVHPSSDVELFHLRFLVNACPFLHRFVLRLHVSGPQVERTKKTTNIEAYPHHQLKILEVVGFVGLDVDTAFVKYLIESAVSLEKMIIKPTCMQTNREPSVEERGTRAIHQAELLQPNLKSGVVFQISE